MSSSTGITGIFRVYLNDDPAPAAVSKNIILDNGFQKILSAPGGMRLIFASLGSAEDPSLTYDRTGMTVGEGVSVISSINRSDQSFFQRATVHGSADLESATPYAFSKFYFLFPRGTAAGTWTEIGVGNSSSDLWSHSKFSEPLVLGEFDTLTVEYELRMYVSLGGGSYQTPGGEYFPTTRARFAPPFNDHSIFKVESIFNEALLAPTGSTVARAFENFSGATGSVPVLLEDPASTLFAVSSPITGVTGGFSSGTFTKTASFTFPDNTASSANFEVKSISVNLGSQDNNALTFLIDLEENGTFAKTNSNELTVTAKLEITRLDAE